MCDPVSITMVVIAAAGAIYGAHAQDQAAEENRKIAEANYKAQMESLELQRKQTNEQAIDKKSEVASQEQARMAALRVAAGESGVAGLSVDRAMGEIEQDEAMDIASIESNRKYAMKQTSAGAAQLYAQKMGNINRVPRANWGATALQIGGAAAGAYAKSYTPGTAGTSNAGGAAWSNSTPGYSSNDLGSGIRLG